MCVFVLWDIIFDMLVSQCVLYLIICASFIHRLSLKLQYVRGKQRSVTDSRTIIMFVTSSLERCCAVTLQNKTSHTQTNKQHPRQTCAQTQTPHNKWQTNSRVSPNTMGRLTFTYSLGNWSNVSRQYISDALLRRWDRWHSYCDGITEWDTFDFILLQKCKLNYLILCCMYYHIYLHIMSRMFNVFEILLIKAACIWSKMQ